MVKIDGGGVKMITLLNRKGWGWAVFRGGVCPNDYNITWGGSLGTPKSDYIICARPPIEKSAKSEFWL